MTIGVTLHTVTGTFTAALEASSVALTTMTLRVTLGGAGMALCVTFGDADTALCVTSCVTFGGAGMTLCVPFGNAATPVRPWGSVAHG